VFAGSAANYAAAGIYPGIGDNFGFLASFLAILVLGTPALFVSALRSKDRTLRKNLGWFGLFVAAVLSYTEIGYLGFVLGILTNSSSTVLPTGFVIVLALISFLPVIGGFGLYRSARSLASINRVPTSDT
jgi:hypothetical protein